MPHFFGDYRTSNKRRMYTFRSCGLKNILPRGDWVPKTWPEGEEFKVDWDAERQAIEEAHAIVCDKVHRPKVAENDEKSLENV